MEETLLSLAKLSPVVAILAWIVWMQGKRVDRYEAASASREKDMQTACEQRETRLADRLTAVEERSNAQMAEVLHANAETAKVTAEATRTFARALDRWTDRLDAGSDRHPTRSAQ